jgi:hypothetical protein
MDASRSVRKRAKTKGPYPKNEPTLASAGPSLNFKPNLLHIQQRLLSRVFVPKFCANLVAGGNGPLAAQPAAAI